MPDSRVLYAEFSMQHCVVMTCNADKQCFHLLSSSSGPKCEARKWKLAENIIVLKVMRCG